MTPETPATTLPQLLERLLTDPAFREAFIAGRAVAPDVLGTIDPVQLERTAQQLRKDLAQRQFRGSGGIAARFPNTIAAGAAGGVGGADALFARFIASAAYHSYREWPRNGEGQCLEEAFYRFAESEDLGDAATREAEFLAAIVRAVLLSPDPGFALPPELSVRPDGAVFALTRRGPVPTLFAATPRGLVQGALTPFLAELLEDSTGASPAPLEVARRHGVSPAVLAAALAQLEALGLACVGRTR